jgi:hypothetical protein
VLAHSEEPQQVVLVHPVRAEEVHRGDQEPDRTPPAQPQP